MADKLQQVASSRPKLNFFNKWTLNLMSTCSTTILSELSVRTFTGSRDVPKDDEKSAGLLKFARDNAITSTDKN